MNTSQQTPVSQEGIDSAISIGEVAARIDLRKGNAVKLNGLSCLYPDKKDAQLLDIAIEAYWNLIDIKVIS
jgi:hypothetical protein